MYTLAVCASARVSAIKQLARECPIQKDAAGRQQSGATHQHLSSPRRVEGGTTALDPTTSKRLKDYRVGPGVIGEMAKTIGKHRYLVT